MIKKGFIFFLLFVPLIVFGQDILVPTSENDTIISQEDSVPAIVPEDSIVMPGKKSGLNRFLPANANTAQLAETSLMDTTQSINYWRITRRTGEIVPGKPDTLLTDYFHRTNAEGSSVAVAYLGNLGLPMESRIFFERADRSRFMFADPYYAYAQSPDKFNFINTKIPYSNISYQRAGSRENMEERLQSILAVNFGKKLNVGAQVDYLYARGFYDSQSAKHLEWVFFGNYLSDRHRVHLFVNPSDYTNAENGGLVEDNYITHPDLYDTNLGTKNFQTRISNTWNQLKGTNIYLNYHYNLGFERNTDKTDEEGDTIKRFIPVSAIIYTLDYKDKKKRFYTKDSLSVNEFYDHRDFLNNGLLTDSTSHWEVNNTLGLSMREGFSSWAKFDLTAFLTQSVRNYTMMDTARIDTMMLSRKTGAKSTYVGGELAKRTGQILHYDAQGSFGLLGSNLGDINLSGHIETRIPFLKDTASVNARGHIKNLEPSYYEKHYHSKYFWWDNSFGKIKKVFVGGDITIPQTKTIVGLGVENVTNYIYFDKTGYPRQHTDNIQIIAANLKQNFRYKAFHWDNQVVYQTTSDESVIPLPDLSLYSSMFVEFKVAKVLTIQMGANVHYWTKYYAPTYEPATQQFRLQNEILIGNYPLISAFVNCHLKQTRFFIEYYNAGASYISPPEYFSLPHYPVNPTVLKMGLSVDFIN